MKVSIIVPVYNVQMYVKECIESLVNQSLNEMEIIVVDDGSTDKSIDIIKKTFNDERIKILTQKNGGLSAARNAGIKAAKGEYLAFVDSDDFIGYKNAYEEMYNIAIKEKSDIVSGNAIWYYSEDNKEPMNPDFKEFHVSPMKNEEFFLACLQTKRIYAPVWLSIYKRSFLLENDLHFKEGVYHEDEEFTPRVLMKANYVSNYREKFYFYRQREGSITNSSLNYKCGKDMLEICCLLEKIIDDMKNEDLKYLFKRYIFTRAIAQLFKYKFENVSKDVKDMIKRNAVSFKFKITSLLLNYNEKSLYYIEDKIKSMKNKK